MRDISIPLDAFPDTVTDESASRARAELERICELEPDGAERESGLVFSIGHTVTEATWPYVIKKRVPYDMFCRYEDGSRVPARALVRTISDGRVIINPSRVLGRVRLMKYKYETDSGILVLNAALPFGEIDLRDPGNWRIYEGDKDPKASWRITDSIEQLLPPIQRIAGEVLDIIENGVDDPSYVVL